MSCVKETNSDSVAKSSPGESAASLNLANVQPQNDSNVRNAAMKVFSSFSGLDDHKDELFIPDDDFPFLHSDSFFFEKKIDDLLSFSSFLDDEVQESFDVEASAQPLYISVPYSFDMPTLKENERTEFDKQCQGNRNGMIRQSEHAKENSCGFLKEENKQVLEKAEKIECQKQEKREKARLRMARRRMHEREILKQAESIKKKSSDFLTEEERQVLEEAEGIERKKKKEREYSRRRGRQIKLRTNHKLPVFVNQITQVVSTAAAGVLPLNSLDASQASISNLSRTSFDELFGFFGEGGLFFEKEERRDLFSSSLSLENKEEDFSMGESFSAADVDKFLTLDEEVSSFRSLGDKSNPPYLEENLKLSPLRLLDFPSSSSVNSFDISGKRKRDLEKTHSTNENSFKRRKTSVAPDKLFLNNPAIPCASSSNSSTTSSVNEPLRPSLGDVFFKNVRTNPSLSLVNEMKEEEVEPKVKKRREGDRFRYARRKAKEKEILEKAQDVKEKEKSVRIITPEDKEILEKAEKIRSNEMKKKENRKLREVRLKENEMKRLESEKKDEINRLYRSRHKEKKKNILEQAESLKEIEKSGGLITEEDRQILRKAEDIEYKIAKNRLLCKLYASKKRMEILQQKKAKKS